MTPGTIRQEIRSLLRAGPATAKDISRRVGVAERDVAAHLEHLSRSLRRGEETLRVEPSRCHECEFVFGDRDRHRFTRPGRCPRCHGRRTSLPRFWIESAGSR